ncbi:MAG: hypothetical protein HYV27_13910 [Candidatus Hydrogenedentes bacterium]|nr:hypothetical protein [Candidatus Hydrogenedentota bacterium]
MGISEFIKTDPAAAFSGMIHECGMASRYRRIFSPKERAFIEENQGDFPFTRGNYFATRPEDYDVLVDLLHFSARFDGDARAQYVNVRLQSLGMQYLIAISDWRRFHNLMQTLIPAAYRLREHRKFALPFAKRLCKRHIEYTPMILQAAANVSELPAHYGYEYYMRMLEEHSRFPRAIQCCDQAQKEGWQGSWDKHRERLLQKQAGVAAEEVQPGTGDRLPKLKDSLIRVRCPECGFKMKVPRNYSKTEALCIQCGAHFNLIETQIADGRAPA